MTETASNKHDETQRLALVERIVSDPPKVHPQAPSGVWYARRDCYEFLAQQVSEGARTLETGCGVSTALFTAWGCSHLCVVPSVEQRDVILAYCKARDIDTERLEFDLRPSDVALPERVGDGPLDLVLIDGCHGFPLPIVDWYYGAGRLRPGGVVIVDDLQLPQVSNPLSRFLHQDDRWQELHLSGKWSAYRRQSEGSLGEEWTEQEFFGKARSPYVTAALDVLERTRRFVKR